jgi:hypothetical protein
LKRKVIVLKRIQKQIINFREYKNHKYLRIYSKLIAFEKEKFEENMEISGNIKKNIKKCLKMKKLKN